MTASDAITNRTHRLTTVRGDTVPEHRVQFGQHRHGDVTVTSY